MGPAPALPTLLRVCQLNHQVVLNNVPAGQWKTYLGTHRLPLKPEVDAAEALRSIFPTARGSEANSIGCGGGARAKGRKMAQAADSEPVASGMSASKKRRLRGKKRKSGDTAIFAADDDDDDNDD